MECISIYHAGYQRVHGVVVDKLQRKRGYQQECLEIYRDLRDHLEWRHAANEL